MEKGYQMFKTGSWPWVFAVELGFLAAVRLFCWLVCVAWGVA